MEYAAGASVAEAKLADGEAPDVSRGNLACTACAGQKAGSTDTCIIYR